MSLMVNFDVSKPILGSLPVSPALFSVCRSDLKCSAAVPKSSQSASHHDGYGLIL